MCRRRSFTSFRMTDFRSRTNRDLGHDEEAAAGVAVGLLAALDFLLGGAEDLGAEDGVDVAALCA